MKKFIYHLMLFLFFYPITLLAEKGDNESVLKKLDKVIENKHSFHVNKEKEIGRIKNQIHHSHSDEEKYELCGSLFYLYLHYQADSSLYYIDEKMKLLPLLDRPELKNEIIINRAEVMGVMGMYNESLEQLRLINSKDLDPETLTYYYRTFRAYYGWIADYTTSMKEKQKYLERTDAYRDSIIATASLGIDRNIVLAEKLMVMGKPDSSQVILNDLLKQNPDRRQTAYIYYTLSEVHDAMKDKDKQIYYLTLTALVDLESATREYASLQKLAQQMYREGDIDRAYKYLNCSMEDAVSCNARLRFIEVAQFYPIIDKAYKLKEKKNDKFFMHC